VAGSEFSDFVKKQTEAAKQPPIDWQAKKDEWLDRLAQLYKQVEDYLDEFTRAGQIKLATHSVVITEEYIGTYHADAMTIQIGARQVELRPIGTLLIGSAGRVDMVGPGGSAKIVLTPTELQAPTFRVSIRTPDDAGAKTSVPEDIDWVWKLVELRPSMHYLTLDQESFRSAVMEVVGG
jgi:hypothetical protein